MTLHEGSSIGCISKRSPVRKAGARQGAGGGEGGHFMFMHLHTGAHGCGSSKIVEGGNEAEKRVLISSRRNTGCKDPILLGFSVVGGQCEKSIIQEER